LVSINKYTILLRVLNVLKFKMNNKIKPTHFSINLFTNMLDINAEELCYFLLILIICSNHIEWNTACANTPLSSKHAASNAEIWSREV